MKIAKIAAVVTLALAGVSASGLAQAQALVKIDCSATG